MAPKPNEYGPPRRHLEDPPWVRRSLIAAALLVLTLLIVVPMASVFYQALRPGLSDYWGHLVGDRETRHAILLTLFVAPLAVLANVVFGVAAAWAVARYRFPGRTLLVTLIDLPFSVSPVVAGLLFVLLFGRNGYFGPALEEWGIRVLFTVPGLILVTTFVTLPFVARELIPLLESLGPEEELAAVSLGASGWQMFRLVTLPNIQWGLLYGVILANTRAMGEFGAVYVVSGKIAGATDTMPLRVEKLMMEYDSPAAFAVASLLTLLAATTLLLKALVERKMKQQLTDAPG
ncbi:MAG: sulfate ABC transporter permease subunit CysW [Gemmataceae bacterium]|nr:sulfate ABC transporter permease subunit CysW [Gemmataceae bacterium]